MTSSMLAGEKRWASARRGGMTVLGKVAVPKPLNLPSQRLENHGLDPNVEIVPKGTLSWGSGSSSSASNAWGSSAVSPNADGGTRSPSHRSGRPSSGSGTRPSTACSDRIHESIPNAWGPNSRPSSASGALTSTQTALTYSRPRSAETRPCSSQLSRFAEPSDNSVAWGPTGVSEKLGVASSKNDGFSLCSGDFPTLGSERENSGKSTDSLDHGSYGRPSSSASRAASGKEKSVTSSAGDTAVNANVNSGTVNTWRKDGSQHVEDDVQPALEKRQGDPPPYVNANVPPQHFDTWHGPPINPPPGVWYRGPPGVPHYAAPLAPGGFPIEPFPYYHPQIPPAALGNSQPVPPPASGPRGHPPKNGDMYRPHIPDAYIRPGMPMRPGFFPGPMAYEGYYGPPMGFCNSNERDIPFIGIPAGPSVYNRYSSENALHSGKNHARTGLHGSTGKASVPEQVESGHPDDTRVPYKVLLKQHDEWDDKRDHAVPVNAPYLGKGDQPRKSSQKNEWGLEDRKDEDIYSGSRILDGDASSQSFDDRGRGSSDSGKVKLPENKGKAKAVDDNSINKLGNLASTLSQAPQTFPATPKDPTLIQKIEGLNAKAWASDGRPDAISIPCREEQKSRPQVVDAKGNPFINEVDDNSINKLGNLASTLSQAPQTFPATPKDPTLIQKIEGLNAKARASDGRPDAISIPCREEQKSRPQVVDAKGNTFINEVASRNLSSTSHKVEISTADKTLQPAASSGTAISRRASHGPHGVQSRLDHHGKKFTQDADGWRKKPLAAEPTSAVSATISVLGSSLHVEDRLPAVPAAENYGINLQEKDEGESLSPMIDSGDCQVQRAKMREIAKQRAIQLQKEEEERIREQKAKALAKLEELNRRTQAMDSSTQKSEKAPPSGPIRQEQEECHIPAELVMVVASKSETPSSVLVTNPNAQIRESSPIMVGESAVLSKDTFLETSDNVQPESAVPHGQPVPLRQDAHTAGADCKTAPLVNEGSVARHKHVGYKQKQNISLAKNLTEKLVPDSPTEAPKTHVDVAVNDDAPTEVVAGEVDPSCDSTLPMNSNIMVESGHQRKKNNRSSKSKHKLDDVSSITALPSAVPKQIKAENISTESGMPKDSELGLDPGSVQPRTVTKHAAQPSEQHPILPGEEASGRVNSQWKSQHSRRMPRNQQNNRMAEKFHNSDSLIWAPVRSHNKAEVMDEASNKTLPDIVTATEKSDNVVHINLKSKRAEIERYVPKPVAKELAQQGSVQQSVQISSDSVVRAEPFQSIESCQPGNSAAGNVVSTVESIDGHAKQNKQSKAHGLWRQRQGLQDGNPSKNRQNSVQHNQSLKTDVNSIIEQTKASDDWNTGDGWNTPDNSDTTAPVTSVVKDQGVVTGRGKRHPMKGRRSVGNNHDRDHRNVNCEDTDRSSSQTPPEIVQTDKSIASREDRAIGDRATTHWQPKPQVYSVHNQRGNKLGGGQNVNDEVSSAMKKDSPSQDRVHHPRYQSKEIREHKAQPSIDQPLYEQKDMAESPNVGHQESKRERKTASYRGRPYSPNQSSVNMVEPAPPASMDSQNEHFSSGFRKSGNQNQNSRSGRGHDSHGDWSSAGQDNWQHNTPSNRERQRHNSHYEYQPIGQHNDGKSNNFEGPTDGAHNTGSRYKERGQGYSRHGGGNFYGRQSGTVRVDSNYD